MPAAGRRKAQEAAADCPSMVSRTEAPRWQFEAVRARRPTAATRTELPRPRRSTRCRRRCRSRRAPARHAARSFVATGSPHRDRARRRARSWRLHRAPRGFASSRPATPAASPRTRQCACSKETSAVPRPETSAWGRRLGDAGLTAAEISGRWGESLGTRRRGRVGTWPSTLRIIVACPLLRFWRVRIRYVEEQ